MVGKSTAKLFAL